MSEQKTKDFLNLLIRIIVLCGVTAVFIIVLWKLAISDLYFDFTNFTSYDIVIIIVSVFILAVFWQIFIKFLNLIEKVTDSSHTNEELIDRLLSIITEQIKSNKSSENNDNIAIEEKKLYEILDVLNNKLNEISKSIKEINVYYNANQSQTLDITNFNKSQNNNSNEHINLLLKQIITDHFELSTLKMLPIEIFEFRIKKIINELEPKIINDLILYEIIDNKKQLTEKGKAKLVELTNSL